MDAHLLMLVPATNHLFYSPTYREEKTTACLTVYNVLPWMAYNPSVDGLAWEQWKEGVCGK